MMMISDLKGGYQVHFPPLYTAPRLVAPEEDKMNLKVVIPKKYKQKLSKRFNPRHARLEDDGLYHLRVVCELCRDYRSSRRGCTECPFAKFQLRYIGGCYIWMQKILNEALVFDPLINEIIWKKCDNKKAREQLKRLRGKARNLIEWR